MEKQAAEVLEQLTEAYQSSEVIASKVIDNYIPTISESVVQSPSYLDAFIPSITAILQHPQYETIDPLHLTLELLARILSFVDFSQIVSLFTAETIISFITAHESPVSLLCLGVIRDKYGQPATTQFLIDTNAIYSMVEIYFKTDSNTAYYSLVESIIHLVVNDSSFSTTSLLVQNDFLLLYDYAREKCSDDVNLTEIAKVVRLLDYLMILLPKISIDPKYYNFSNEELLNLARTDPLSSVLFIQWYETVVANVNSGEFDQIIVDSFKPTLANLAVLYNHQDVDQYFKNHVVYLLARLSYSKPNDYALSLARDNHIFDKINLEGIFGYEEPDIGLLSCLNPDVIVQANPNIFDEILSKLPLYNNQYFKILINMIRSKTAFETLQAYFSTQKLSELTSDKLFRVLAEFSRYSHSKQYLLTQLPNIVTNDIIDESGRKMITGEVWNLKVETLENLLEEDILVEAIDYWKPQLSNTLEAMKYGRKMRDVNPGVEVMDTTM